MELAEVKKHFENAVKIKDHAGDEGFVELEKIRLSNDGVNAFIQNPFKKNWLVLWHNKKGFAKILTTKEPSFSITKYQIRQLTDPKVKEWFPEVFEVKLEVGKWYNFKNGAALFNYQENGKIYGFLYKNWHITDSWTWEGTKNVFEATNEEVFEALKNEAVKMGFVEGNIIKNIETEKKCFLELSENGFLLFDEKTLNFGNQVIFLNGTWAKVYKKL